VFLSNRAFNLRFKYVLLGPVASLWLVSPDAVTDSVTLFHHKKWCLFSRRSRECGLFLVTSRPLTPFSTWSFVECYWNSAAKNI